MATNQNSDKKDPANPNPNLGENKNTRNAADKNWHAQQSQAVPDPNNSYQPGHAQNKDQLNRLTDRKDNHNKNVDAHGNRKG